MKKSLIAAALLCAVAGHAQAQTMPTVLDSISQGYQAIVRIHPGYIAALREGALDIRAAGFHSLGTPATSLPMPGVPIMGGFLATKGSTVYAIRNDLTPVDISTPTAPVAGSLLALPYEANGVLIWNDLMILSAGFKTYIYSVAAPATPALLDSLDGGMTDFAGHGNRLYARKSYGQLVYSYSLSATAPYLTLNDSTDLHSTNISIDLTGNQLLAKSPDTLYRYDLNAATDFQLLAAEALPNYPYTGRLTAIDTNYIGYSLYNSFWLSYGHTGNSFVDSLALGYGDYFMGKGRLDGSVFYADVQSTRLIGFANAASVSQQGRAMDASVYPNPVSDVLWVIIPQRGDCTYTLSNALGATAATGSLSSGNNAVSTTDLPAGVYLLQLRNARGEAFSGKIVKQ